MAVFSQSHGCDYVVQRKQRKQEIGGSSFPPAKLQLLTEHMLSLHSTSLEREKGRKWRRTEAEVRHEGRSDWKMDKKEEKLRDDRRMSKRRCDLQAVSCAVTEKPCGVKEKSLPQVEQTVKEPRDTTHTHARTRTHTRAHTHMHVHAHSHQKV